MIQGQEVDVSMWRNGGEWFVRISNDMFACTFVHKKLLKAYVNASEAFADGVDVRASASPSSDA